MSRAVISQAVAHALDPVLTPAHQLTQFCFDALVAGAARPRPGKLALADHHDGARAEISFADLYQNVGAFLARLQNFDLSAGEKILICAAPGAQTFVALTACLAARLEPVLAPLPLPTTLHALARAAREYSVSALFAPASFCDLDFEEPLLSLAAQTPSIRCIGALAGALDGAADFTRDMLEAPLSPRARLSEEWTTEERQARVGALDEVGGVHFLSQGALLGAALDLVRATRSAGAAPFLSLAAPSTFAALAAGPLAALMTAAPLHYLAPFVASRFVEALDALGPARLVTPAILLPDLARAGVLSSGAVLSVTALASGEAPTPRLTPQPVFPIVELRAAQGVLSLRVLR